MKYLIDKEILRLQIPMDYVLLMHFLQPLSHLLDYSRSFFLGKFLFLLHVLETAIWEGLQDQIQVLFIMKVTEEGSQVRMIQV